MMKKGLLIGIGFLFFSVVSLSAQDISIYSKRWITNRLFDMHSSASTYGNRTAADAEASYIAGNYREAAELYKSAVEMYPYGEWYFNLGNCLYFLGEYPEATGAFAAAAFLNCDTPQYAYYNAACTESLRQSDTGYYYLEMAFRAGFAPESHAWNDPDLAYLLEFKEFAQRIAAGKNPPVIHSSALAGQWIDQPMVAAAMPGNYNFCWDGSFSYFPAEIDGQAGGFESAGRSFRGSYRIEKGFLYLTLDEVPGITLSIAVNEIRYDGESNIIQLNLDQTTYWSNGPPREPYCEPFAG